MTVLSMSHKELSRFDTLQRVERRELSTEDAAVLLGVLRRQIFRMLAAVRERGAQGLVSGKRGRPSNRRLSSTHTEIAIALVREHYHDLGPTFAAEKLIEQASAATPGVPTAISAGLRRRADPDRRFAAPLV